MQVFTTRKNPPSASSTFGQSHCKHNGLMGASESNISLKTAAVVNGQIWMRLVCAQAFFVGGIERESGGRREGQRGSGQERVQGRERAKEEEGERNGEG